MCIRDSLCEARKGCQNTLKALDGDIKKVNQDIQCTIQSDPYLRELYELIESVKGVGPAIATEILIVTNERPPLRFKNINEPKKFACHAGVVPFVYASGQYKGKAKTSNKANKQLKALLHNAGRPVAGYVGHTTFAGNQSVLLTKDRRGKK